MIPSNKSNQQKRTSLLSQSKKTGANQGFTDVFTPLVAGMKLGQAIGANQQKPQVGLNDRIKSEIKHDLENGVFDYNWTNIKSLPADKQNFITNAIRTNYYEKAQMSMLRNQMDPTDPNRGMIMMEEDMKTDFAANLNTNLSQLEQLKNAYLQDEDGNAMSDLVPPETKGQILGMIKGELPMNIDPSGNLIFGEGENAFTMKDAPSYFNKDFKSANAMLKSYESVYNTGKPLSAGSKQMYMNDFHEMLNAGGDNSIMSLSFDNVMGMYETVYDEYGNLTSKPTSFLSKEQYANELNALQRGTPEQKEAARQTLKQALTQSYMTSLETQAQAGVKAAGTGGDSITEPKKVNLESWYNSFVTDDNPNGVPSFQDWRLQLENTPGKAGTKWEKGFDIITRGGAEATGPTFTSEAYGLKGKTYTQKQLAEDILGTTIAEFNKLTSYEKAKLFKKYKIDKYKDFPSNL